MSKLTYTFEQANQISLQKGVKFISEEFKTVKEKYIFECVNDNCSYRWETTFTTILKPMLRDFKTKCPKCNKFLKYTIKEIEELYYKNNMILLNKNYINRHVPLETECKICNFTKYPNSNVPWKVCLKSVQVGMKCPNCLGKLKYTVEKINDICFKKKIKFLSNEYKDALTSYEFKCLKINCGHKWNTTFSHINVGSGCPECSNNKMEKIVKECVKELFPNIILLSRKINVPLFNKLKIQIKKYFIVDLHFLIEKQRFYIEYNGIQHYEPTKFSYKVNDEEIKNKFIVQQERDLAEREYCKENNINLIEIDGRIYKTKEQVKNYLTTIIV